MITINKELCKKVFILEDDDNRIAWFKDKFLHATTLFITKQTGTALEALHADKYDLIFLDHDLEPDHYSAYSEGREPQMELTGLYVAKKLKETQNVDTPCIIHSMNPCGALNMHDEIPGSYVCPFSMLMLELEVV